MIDIGILDSHPVVRAGLRRLFSQQSDLRVAGEAASSAEAAAWLSGPGHPDVLILDLPEAGMYGVDAMARIHAAAPKMDLLVFTAHPAGHYAIEALRQGARCYLNKNSEPKDIVDAVRTVSSGRRYFSAEVTQLLAQQLDRVKGGPAHEQLSERELQVLCKLAKGDTAGGIAASLSLSVKTVSTYRTRLMGKLSLHSNSDLTYYALNNRLIM